MITSGIKAGSHAQVGCTGIASQVRMRIPATESKADCGVWHTCTQRARQSNEKVKGKGGRLKCISSTRSRAVMPIILILS